MGELSAKSQIKDIEGLFDQNRRLFKYDIGTVALAILFAGSYVLLPDTNLAVLLALPWFGSPEIVRPSL